MKYEQSYTEFDYSVVDLVKDAIPSSFAEECGDEFAFPQDQELELKIKYDIKEDGGSISLKLSWDNVQSQEEYED